MIFKPKISHQKPIKPPLKADFNAYFTKKRMIFTPIYKICATPKGPFRVRFPAGVPNKKEPSGSFLFGFRCGSGPVVRPIAQQWHERRNTHGKPHTLICAKYSRREHQKDREMASLPVFFHGISLFKAFTAMPCVSGIK